MKNIFDSIFDCIYGTSIVLFMGIILILIYKAIFIKTDLKSQCLNIADITATNPLVKDYHKSWYKLKDGECSVSSDYKDIILVDDKNKKYDIIYVEGIGRFTVKSYMSSIDKKTGTPIKKTIDIFKPSVSECMRFGRKRARVFLEYK